MKLSYGSKKERQLKNVHFALMLGCIIFTPSIPRFVEIGMLLKSIYSGKNLEEISTIASVDAQSTKTETQYGYFRRRNNSTEQIFFACKLRFYRVSLEAYVFYPF